MRQREAEIFESSSLSLSLSLSFCLSRSLMSLTDTQANVLSNVSSASLLALLFTPSLLRRVCLWRRSCPVGCLTALPLLVSTLSPSLVLSLPALCIGERHIFFCRASLCVCVCVLCRPSGRDGCRCRRRQRRHHAKARSEQRRGEEDARVRRLPGVN